MSVHTIKPLKVRGWKLSDGTILVLLFIRTAEDKLELLSEQYADDEAGVMAIVDEARKVLDGALEASGLEGHSYAEFPGAKKA